MSLSDLFGEEEQVVEEVKQEVEKPLNVFDIINSIYFSKNFVLTDETNKIYVKHVINKALSMGQDTIYFANEMNRMPHLSNDMHFLFLSKTIRKRKRYNKWMKSVKDENIDVIKFFMKRSTKEAKLLLTLLDENQINELKETMKKILQ